MPADVSLSAPPWLANLPPGQIQGIIEAPRGRRLALLAQARNLTEEAALAGLAAACELETTTTFQVDTASLPLFPARLVHDFQIIPVKSGKDSPDTLCLVTVWPPDDDLIDWLALFTARPLGWRLAAPEKVQKLILEHYGLGAGSLEDSDQDLPANAASSDAETEGDADAAVVRFVHEVIGQAIADGATDIHFEPREEQLQIRYRIDGLLVPMPVPTNLLRFQDAIISRLKIMARLNISEKRLPQDGRISFKSGSTALDIRLSTYPTVYAESVSLRLLNQRRQALTLAQLGMNEAEQRLVAQVVDFPHGIILVTGPTGSGKSTSLNAFLRQINSAEQRIVTIEDPIEYEVPGANQGQVHAEIGLNFASALRHMLRQDPDVIMVGEIRDLETAEIAIQASLTGHLVLSTLHTNDASGAITRLIDMGIEPFLVASAIELIIAQRLVRKLCPVCAQIKPVNRPQILKGVAALGLDPSAANGLEELPVPVGCDQCRQTGYRGRIGLFEILRPNEALHDMIVRRESARALALCARQNGLRTLNHSGWEKIRAGLTTLDEVLRVIAVPER